MNKIIIIGNLTKDVEYKTNNSSMAKFSVAVKRPHSKDETDFFDVVAWDKLADICNNHLKKGSKVAVSGYLVTNSYTTENGQKRFSLSIRAEEVEFLSLATKSGNGDIPF